MEDQILSFQVLFSFLLFLLVLFKVSKKLYKHDSNPPPGPRKLPFFGNILQLAGDVPHRRLTALAKTYGPVMGIKLGQIPFLVVSSPETAKEVMKIQDPVFAERALLVAVEIVLYNRNDIVFGLYGDQWRQMRKICTLELLSAKRVQSFRSVREEEVADLVKFLGSKEGSPVNLTHTLFALANSIIARNTVGHKSKNQEALLRLIDDIIESIGGVGIADIFPSLKWLPSVQRERARIRKLHCETDEILEGILEEHKANRQAAAFKNDDGSQADNLLDVLLDLQQSGNLDVPLTDVAIKAAIIVSVYYQRRPRKKVSGYDVYPGTRVFINAWAIGRDPKVWSEAEKFKPERFIDSAIDYRGTNFELIPFGAGKRICPGMTLGMANLEIFLANLLYQFDWKFPKGVTAEKLDMNEAFGAAGKRKVDLELVPIPYRP
ncbi:hypothetical protein JCGZ_15291 [Jatropha curcas]|uniref:Cytochrome P450 n=1 Tax=Jatropha curcas TaxID=180498 RepID=A0A067LBT2_JATCU|nr:hypothetical protein JCGZ_15291 [Jatropha curcas]